MIGGQVLDLKYEAADPSLQQLLTVHKLKTGATDLCRLHFGLFGSRCYAGADRCRF